MNSPVHLQDSDNPDLRDRGYIYWRLLSTDPVTAKEVVLSEKPLISEETDLIEPTLLDELICHIGSLASVYHKPPSAFVEGSHGIHRKHLPVQHSRSDTQRVDKLLKIRLVTILIIYHYRDMRLYVFLDCYILIWQKLFLCLVLKAAGYSKVTYISKFTRQFFLF